MITLAKMRFIMITLLVIGACTDNPGNPEELVIAAAANLQFSLKDIGDRYMRETGHGITFVWGATGILTTQIENGAPYDFFFSAERDYAERLRESGLVYNDTLYSFVSGTIALGVSSLRHVTVDSLEDLRAPEVRRIVIAAPRHAPYGRAAQEALKNGGIWDAIQEKLVYAENIRQCLQMIASGNVDAGIISANIPPVDGVTRVALDPQLYSAPRQVAVILKKSRRTAEAERFLRFLQKPENRTVLEHYRYRINFN